MTQVRNGLAGAALAALVLASPALHAQSFQQMFSHGMGGQGMGFGMEMGPGTGMTMMFGPGWMTSGPMPMMRSWGPMVMMFGPGTMDQYVEGRIAFLKVELGITQAQEPQWSAFAEALRVNARTMADLQQRMAQPSAPTTLPQRLQAHRQMLTVNVEALQRVEATVGPLYGAMSDQQRQTADRLLLGMGGMSMNMSMGSP